MGRKKIEIDPKIVERLAQRGCKVVEIADFYECSDQTIHRRFESELRKGESKLKISLREKQIELALSGNVTMLIWLGKQLLGQSDKLDIRAVTTDDIVKELERRIADQQQKPVSSVSSLQIPPAQT